jgi:hypothetical protein
MKGKCNILRPTVDTTSPTIGVDVIRATIVTTESEFFKLIHLKNERRKESPKK